MSNFPFFGTRITIRSCSGLPSFSGLSAEKSHPRCASLCVASRSVSNAFRGSRSMPRKLNRELSVRDCTKESCDSYLICSVISLNRLVIAKVCNSKYNSLYFVLASVFKIHEAIHIALPDHTLFDSSVLLSLFLCDSWSAKIFAPLAYSILIYRKPTIDNVKQHCIEKRKRHFNRVCFRASRYHVNAFPAGSYRSISASIPTYIRCFRLLRKKKRNW